MAKVIVRKLRPGETIFGGGAGVVSWNVYPKKRSPSATAGSPPDAPPSTSPPADARDTSSASPRPLQDQYPIEEMVRRAMLKLDQEAQSGQWSGSPSTSRKSDADT